MNCSHSIYSDGTESFHFGPESNADRAFLQKLEQSLPHEEGSPADKEVTRGVGGADDEGGSLGSQD